MGWEIVDRKDKEEIEKEKMLVDDKINVGDIAEKNSDRSSSRGWKVEMKLWWNGYGTRRMGNVGR